MVLDVKVIMCNVIGDVVGDVSGDVTDECH